MENPLKTYKKENGLLWSIIMEKTGLSRQSLHRIAEMESFEDMQNIRLGVYLKLREGVGVDLLDNN